MLDYEAIEAELKQLDPRGSDKEESVYADESAEQKSLLQSAPWRQDPDYFQHVRISSLALVRMSMHARAGKTQEVMGVLTGKIKGDTFVVLDCYPLPVEATETRVNAMGEAYEYMVQYLESLEQVGRNENIVGWYHSHPGYGCWLSRIDVGTQMQNQAFQDPFLAIVIDPNRTLSDGIVDIGAFRTYPENHRKAIGRSRQNSSANIGLETAQGSTTSLTSTKARDYGLYADKYYPLEISYFSSPLDEPLFELVWNKYWTSLLAEDRLAADLQTSAAALETVATRMEQVSQFTTQVEPSRGYRRADGPAGVQRRLALDSAEIASTAVATLLATKVRDHYLD